MLDTIDIGEYGQELLLQNEELDDKDKYIQFYGRDEATTLQQITDKLELEMNMAFDHIVNDIYWC